MSNFLHYQSEQLLMMSALVSWGQDSPFRSCSDSIDVGDEMGKNQERVEKEQGNG